MVVHLKTKMKTTSVFKKRAVGQRKTRSVPSLIAKNKRALQKLKPQESSEDSDDSSVSEVNLSGKSRDGAEDMDSDKYSNESDKEDAAMSGDDSDRELEADLFDDKKHKKSLAKLKETDPEFYQFLEENDKKLLQFGVSDSDSDGEDENKDIGGKVHKPPEKLEIDSDEDDFEEGEMYTGASGKLITLAMVSDWQKQLQAVPSVQLITEVVKAFQAALQTVSGITEAEYSDYRVDGSSVFNAVVQLCVIELQPALLKLLNLPSKNMAKGDPAKSKRWNKMKHTLKSYLTDLLKLLGAVSSANILTVMLKHLHQMTVFFGYYHSLVKLALKQLIGLWSSSAEETVRVVAFLCILRLTTNQQKSLLDSVLKMMYVAFISNSKFISASTLANVTFMRRSLAEMFCLDATVSYQHAFLYIRQLAIHLRNAITVHKNESIQAVCNWQYMNSLRLWVDLICSTNDESPLRALLYPLTQIIIGCIKLVSTAQYIPLRFHCCQLLTKLSQDTNTYIPVLPFIVESLILVDFNKKNKKLSIKPMDFTCVLRLSKAGLGENGFKDALVEEVYHQLIQYCAGESHRISFPDIIVPCIVQLKNVIKECRTGKYSQKLRQAQTKIEESSRFIEAERRKVVLNLGDSSAVAAWETKIRTNGTPLTKFYESWKKVHEKTVAKRATNNDKLGDFKLPLMKKNVKKEGNSAPSGPVVLFPSDSEDDDDLVFGSGEESQDIKTKKNSKKTQKRTNIKVNKLNEEEIKEESESDSMEDIVEELRLSDFD